jgi:SAM-dependent methyltransferase
MMAAHFKRQKNFLNRYAADKLQWPRYASGVPKFRCIPVAGYIGVIPTHLNNEMIVPAICDLITAEADAVIEVGCGYGRHLFGIRDIVEHDRPELQYFGAEASETGLEAGRQLAALEPARASITFHPFNYLNPEFSFLSGVRNPLFFTCHSIEQVRQIGSGLFRAMATVAQQVRCHHHEPVGWQFNDDVRKLEPNDPIFLTRMYRMFEPVDDVLASSMPIHSGWNRDFGASPARIGRARTVED